MNDLKNILSGIDEIEDDQEFIEMENEILREYCIEKNFKLPDEDMEEIIQRGMEDAYEFWKGEFGNNK